MSIAVNVIKVFAPKDYSPLQREAFVDGYLSARVFFNTEAERYIADELGSDAEVLDAYLQGRAVGAEHDRLAKKEAK